MKKQIVALTAVLCACATVATAQVRITLRGGIKNLHRQGVVGLVKGNTGSVLSQYHGVRPVVKPRSMRVRVAVRGGAKNLHQQGVNSLVRGKNEATLSQYHGISQTAVERQVTQQVTRKPASSTWEPTIPQQVRTTVTKEEVMRQSTYEVRVPNEHGGFDVYERAADGTLTKKP